MTKLNGFAIGFIYGTITAMFMTITKELIGSHAVWPVAVVMFVLFIILRFTWFKHSIYEDEDDLQPSRSIGVG
jgi:hypothetical protein